MRHNPPLARRRRRGPADPLDPFREDPLSRARPGPPAREPGQPHVWLDELLDRPHRRARIEDYLGESLGPLLGCGYFGCAFLLEPPWVAKFTTDASEAATWDLLLELAGEGVDLPGMTRARSVTRVLPDVDVAKGMGDERRPLFVVVREAMRPFVDVLSHAHKLKEFSAATLEHLSAGQAEYVEGLLMDYREIAGAALNPIPFPTPEAEVVWLQKLDLVESEGMRQGAAGCLFDSLSDLRVLYDVLLADVHAANVGWRAHLEIGAHSGEDCLACYDPGLSTLPGGPASRVPRMGTLRTNPRRGAWRRTEASVELGVV